MNQDLKDYVRQNPVSIIVLNDKNQVQTWNTEAEKYFSWNSKDMLGQNILKKFLRGTRRSEQVLSDVHKILLFPSSESKYSQRRQRDFMGMDECTPLRENTITLIL
ncbi:MAG: PAS domain-containing protein [Leptospiraceae bacterium]|nr:PAS domain-containing protein [Leptospiraceae bacterium]